MRGTCPDDFTPTGQAAVTFIMSASSLHDGLAMMKTPSFVGHRLVGK
jgi:hypothetical protein